MTEPPRPRIAGVVLTRNEEQHIRRCLASAWRVCNVIYVVDSHSADRTRAIAEEEGAVIHAGDFTSFSQKLNWAIDTLEIDADWMMRIDADEVLSDCLVEQLPAFLARQSDEVTGIYVRRRLWFMGQPMRFGGMYPRHSMRLWRPRTARCEIRALDEHMLLSRGTSATIEADIEDIPLTNLAHWIAKHNEYSGQEAGMALAEVSGRPESVMRAKLFGSKNERMRWIKEKVFYRMPLFIRPVVYYIYRYVILGGFLDGKAGFVFHFMHGLWYRVLVDAKVLEHISGRDRDSR